MRIHEPFRVVWMNRYRLVTEFLVCTRQLAQEKYPRVLDLGGDELLRHEIHPVPPSADDAEVSLAVQRRQSLLRQVFVQVDDGRPLVGSEAVVDAVDFAFDLRL